MPLNVSCKINIYIQMWAIWRQQKSGASDSHQRPPGGTVGLCNGLTVQSMWQAADQRQMLGAEAFR